MTNNASIVRQFVEEVLNNGNIEATGKYFHEDVVEQVPLPGQEPGLTGLKNVLRGFRAAFPDMHWSIEEQIQESDRAVSRFVWSGTHRRVFRCPRYRAPSFGVGRGDRSLGRRANQGYEDYHERAWLDGTDGSLSSLE